MSDFKCPLEDKKKCPDHELYHFAANKMMMENAGHIKLLKELDARLQAAQKEIEEIAAEMERLKKSL